MNRTQRDGKDQDPVQPLNWADHLGQEDPVEIMSYPVPQDEACRAPSVAENIFHGPDCTCTIMIRTKVGDPTSLIEVPLKTISAFAPNRHEWAGRERKYYSDNTSAFIFVDELVDEAHPLKNPASDPAKFTHLNLRPTLCGLDWISVRYEYAKEVDESLEVVGVPGYPLCPKCVEVFTTVKNCRIGYTVGTAEENRIEYFDEMFTEEEAKKRVKIMRGIDATPTRTTRVEGKIDSNYFYERVKPTVDKPIGLTEN